MGEKTAPAAQTLSDRQGNPIDKSGKLKIETVKTMAEMTDTDFTAPTRNVQLPQIPSNVDAAIGAGGKPVIIKRNIFQKNASTHPELDAKTSREVLDRALYSPNLVGQSQPATKPDYRVAVQTGDKNAATILDVHQGKKHVEIVGWRSIDEKGFERLKRQAAREGGQFLILRPSEEGQPDALSGRPSGSTAQSIPQAGAERQGDKKGGAEAGEQTAPAPAPKPVTLATATAEDARPAKPANSAARRGATPEQLADLRAKIAEAEKVNAAADGGRVDMRRLDPARRTDAKVVAWAKKHGRTVSDGRVTPDAVREYDAQMAQGAAKAVRRWFPDMSVTYHDYGENVTRGRHAIDLRDTAGRALGWFEPRSKDVHLLPGADAATVAHEIMWHGSRDWATARAAARFRRFAEKP